MQLPFFSLVFAAIFASAARSAALIAQGEAQTFFHEPGAKFSVREQGEFLCAAGTRQWTGTIDVGNQKSIFFWFFESRNHPPMSPLVVWLNGGPGGSSMYGLFREIGACSINQAGNGTVFNPNSWSNFANMLYIDQPAGVGFSTVNGSSHGGPKTLEESGKDFEEFMRIFFADVFPQYSHAPLHIAAESYGGHYASSFVERITKRQAVGARNSLRAPVRSIILVDAVLDGITSGPLGHYDHFCKRDESGALLPGSFNETACAALELATPECERLNQVCLDTYDIQLCGFASDFCSENLGKWLEGDVVKGGRNPYDDRKKCIDGPPFCDDWRKGDISTYLNHEVVQEMLGFPGFNYSSVNLETNEGFAESGDMTIPTTKEVSYILDETPIAVLILNGNNDIIVNTEGQIRVWERLPWHKQALFRLERLRKWFWPNKNGGRSLGGELKVAGKLSFVTVNEAGHPSPGDAPESVSFIVDCWLRDSSVEGCPVHYEQHT